MIDPHNDVLIPFSELPRRLRKRGAKRLHLSTIYRWSNRGLRGVRLDYIKIGGSRYTSKEALSAFIDACSATEKNQAPEPLRRKTTRQAQRQAEKARIEVERILGRKS